MSGFNMPPGVSPGDIPGNRNSDPDWDEDICTVCGKDLLDCTCFEEDDDDEDSDAG